MRRRIVSVLTAAALAVVLAACAGLPTSGSVIEGLPADQADGTPDFAFIPDRPQAGASPEQIVEGFIRAGSGPADDWARAKEFLAADFADEWNPGAGVTVVTGERQFSSTEDTAVTVGVVSVATVDDRGSYEWADAAPTTLQFELGQREDGEWRITAAPDGVVLDSNVFPRVYHRYSLMYFDPAWDYLVPDVRWFPTTNAPTRVVDALVNKAPSDWLAASVRTAFPEGVTANSAVPVTSGVASVALDGLQTTDQETLDRMLTQLEASLSTAGIADAEMTVDSAPLTAEPVTTQRTTVSGPPLVVVEAGFGFLSGDVLTPIPGLSDTMAQVAAESIEVTADRGTAAVRTADGQAVRVEADGTVRTVDTRAGLLAPSVDTTGAVWSVPRSDPQAVIVEDPDGARTAVSDAWPGATEITALAVSREGTRIAALVTTGTRSVIWVAGIIRDADGVRLSAPLSLGAASGDGVGLAWLDDSTVGALVRTDDATLVLEQVVGGSSSTTDAPGGIVSIVGAGSASSVRLRADDGTIYVKRGSNWQETASDILVLAHQQGMPG